MDSLYAYECGDCDFKVSGPTPGFARCEFYFHVDLMHGGRGLMQMDKVSNWVEKPHMVEVSDA